eukprot:gnl/Dysnectes_brevis/1646_a1872_1735.p1 GENE.gnl/Dysnectes_brevis/1646_a1872_1735~~gnl/Dysnectes_brevis/1646_a1872_1735.p1  ORF type:complete len:1900 (+),score=787.42 gnl/Dysnectes_brevis/1646_a1872_1735:22-5721(+)
MSAISGELKRTEKGVPLFSSIKSRHGVKVLALITAVKASGLQVSLPNKCTGFIPASEISDLPIEAPLSAVFTCGQYLAAMTVPAQEETIKHGTTYLSSKTSRFKQQVQPESMVACTVLSAEDHGWILSTNPGDQESKLFLPRLSAPEPNDSRLDHPGAVLLTSVTQTGVVANVSLLHPDLTTPAARMPIWKLMPGQCLRVEASRIVSGGIKAFASSGTPCFISVIHARRHQIRSVAPPTAEEPEEPLGPAEEPVKLHLDLTIRGNARVMWVHEETVCVSMLPHHVRMGPPPVSTNGIAEPGTRFHGAQVVAVTPGGIFFALGDGILGHMPSAYSQKRKIALTVGDRVKVARVVSESPMDACVTVSTKSDVLKRDFLSFKEVHCGQLIEVEILTINKSGIAVSLGPQLYGKIPAFHAGSPALRKKLKAGQKIQARIIRKNEDSKSIILSIKSGLLKTDFPVFSTLADIQPGAIGRGWINHIVESKAVVCFAANVKGICFISGDATASLKVGQTALFICLRKADGALTLDLASPVSEEDIPTFGRRCLIRKGIALPGADNPPSRLVLPFPAHSQLSQAVKAAKKLELGSFHQVKLTELLPGGFGVAVEGSENAWGFMPTLHLSDSISAALKLAEHYADMLAAGEEVSFPSARIVSKVGSRGTLLMSVKPSILDNGANWPHMPFQFTLGNTSKLAVGFVGQTDSRGLVVRFGGKLKVTVPWTKALPVESELVPKMGCFAVNQTVVCHIRGSISETSRLVGDLTSREVMLALGELVQRTKKKGGPKLSLWDRYLQEYETVSRQVLGLGSEASVGDVLELVVEEEEADTDGYFTLSKSDVPNCPFKLHTAAAKGKTISKGTTMRVRVVAFEPACVIVCPEDLKEKSTIVAHVPFRAIRADGTHIPVAGFRPPNLAVPSLYQETLPAVGSCLKQASMPRLAEMITAAAARDAKSALPVQLHVTPALDLASASAAAVGEEVRGRVLFIREEHPFTSVFVDLGNGVLGRIFMSHTVNSASISIDPELITVDRIIESFPLSKEMQFKVLAVKTLRGSAALELANLEELVDQMPEIAKRQTITMVYLTARTEDITSKSMPEAGSRCPAVITAVTKDRLVLELITPTGLALVPAVIHALDATEDPDVARNMVDHFTAGQYLPSVRVTSVRPLSSVLKTVPGAENVKLHPMLAMSDSVSIAVASIREDQMPVSYEPGTKILVQMLPKGNKEPVWQPVLVSPARSDPKGHCQRGCVHLTRILPNMQIDKPKDALLDLCRPGSIHRATVVGNKQAMTKRDRSGRGLPMLEVSIREEDISTSGSSGHYERVPTTASSLVMNGRYAAFITGHAKAAVYAMLSEKVTAIIPFKELSDQFIKKTVIPGRFPVGTFLPVRVIEAKGSRVVLSAKPSIVDLPEARPLHPSALKEKMVCVAKVRNHTETALFVDLNTCPKHPAICRVHDMPKNAAFEPGQSLHVVVLAVNATAKPSKPRVTVGCQYAHFEAAGVDPASLPALDVDQAMYGEREDTREAAVEEEDFAIFGDGEEPEKEEDNIEEDRSAAAAESSDDDSDSDSDESSEEALEEGATTFLDFSTSIAGLQGKAKEEDSEESEETELKTKLTNTERRAELEQATAAREEQILADSAPQSTEDFERLLASEETANSSFIWIAYMAYALDRAEVEQARQIGQRALKTIPPAAESEPERLNIWCALVALETRFGSAESWKEVLEEALQNCSPEDLLLALARGSEEPKPYFDKLMGSRRGRRSLRVWNDYLAFLYKDGQNKLAHTEMDRAIKILPDRVHTPLIATVARLEFANDGADRGRTLFEGVLGASVKRTDVWGQYLDCEEKYGTEESARALHMRCCALGLSVKKMKFFFKRAMRFEARLRNPEGVERVREMAVEYVQLRAQKE